MEKQVKNVKKQGEKQRKVIQDQADKQLVTLISKKMMIAFLLMIGMKMKKVFQDKKYLRRFIALQQNRENK